ncbi:Uncharacterised protein [Bacillus freudenreichii]|nr:Uncharacterised protein [Bacillus freudenreichii]
MTNQLSQKDPVRRDRKTINRLEKNQQEPFVSTVSPLAAAFEMAPSEFMKEVEDNIIRKRRPEKSEIPV